MTSGFLGALAALLLLAGAASGAPRPPPLWATLPEPPPLPKPDLSGFTTVHGARLYYAVFNRGAGRPVLLLHGGLASSDAWGYEVPRLRRTHEVIVMDSRGQGRSSRPAGPLSYETMASDVLAVMDELHLRRVAIVGASDGGVIGLILAIHHPERVQALFAWGANFNTHAERKTPPDPALAGAGAAYVARMEARYREMSPTPEGFAELRTALGHMWSTEPDLTPAELGRISAPTVIADGQYEQFIDPEHTRRLASLIPHAKLLIIPDVSHGGPEQDPTAFHRAVTELLDRQGSSR
jgi:pimeloyl-ACP methyl ester carboxylesterase